MAGAPVQEGLVNFQANSVILEKFQELTLIKLINKSTTNHKFFQ
jgi:hypothetical protein